MFLSTLLHLVVVVNVGSATRYKEVTDEEYSQFPRLFHLDDYDSCLSRRGGLYCMGTFYIRPLRDPDPVYELMKEFSKDPHSFNHTLLHRGFCVSSRCGPRQNEPAARFAACAEQWGRKRGYRLTLREVKYCRTHEQKLQDQTWSMKTPHHVFLLTVLGVILVNVIGTVHDMTSEDDKKSRLLSTWSLRDNWSQLVGPYPDGDPRLAAMLPVEAARVIMMLLVIFTHTGIIHDMMYLQNTRLVEQMSHHPVMMLLQNGNTSVQMFIMLSSFLLADELLHMKQPSFTMLPMLVLKRLIRIAPVHLLAVSFAASWWSMIGDGPLWQAVRDESSTCGRKLWAHALFIHNYVDDHQCLVQTWFTAVDMQLYILACGVTLCLIRIRRLALPILGAAFVGSCILNGAMAYINEWKPLFFVSVPENIRTLFREEPSFHEYYSRPLGSLPTMILGLFVAHLRQELNQKGFRSKNHKWLIIGCQLLVVLLPCWTSGGYLLRDYTSRWFMSLYLAVERPGYSLILAGLLFGTYNGTNRNQINKTQSKSSSKGFLQHVFCWRGWHTLGRASLSAMMLHWCVGMTLMSSRLTTITTSTLHMTADFLATTCLTYLVAVPVTLMLEIPIRRFYSALTSNTEEKISKE